MRVAKPCVLSFLFVGALLATAANARGAEAPETDRDVCPVIVLGAVPLDYDKQAKKATRFAVGLQTLNVSGGLVSGTLTFFSGNLRYDIPFTNAVAAGSNINSLERMQPIVVAFPSPIALDAAYVSALQGPDAGPCAPYGVWIGPSKDANGEKPDPSINGTILKLSANASAISAKEPQAQAPMPCASPWQEARITRADIPDTPEIAKARDLVGTVVVEVIIAADGSVEAAWIWATPHPELDENSLEAARRTVYAPAHLGCVPVASTYRFVAAYLGSTSGFR